MEPHIIIRGARENNLKDISLNIPRNKVVIITGLSGSGKSSLAFDTIYAEGQRRYLESLSAYARQFLEQMEKPDVDSIDGLSPAISIEQKGISRNPRSTVGTVTEIYDYLRLLYARVAVPHCFVCKKPIQSQTIQQIVDQVMQLPLGTRFAILSPIARGKKGEFQKELLEVRKQGFTRAMIDGEMVDLGILPTLKKSVKHNISIYVDRLVIKPHIESRMGEAFEIAVRLSGGLTEVELTDAKERRLYSTRFACVNCGTSFPELEPRSFSFNSPHGACEACDGLGYTTRPDPALIINGSKSLLQGAIRPWASRSQSWQHTVFNSLSSQFKFDLSMPFDKLPTQVKDLFLFGSGMEEVKFNLTRGKKNALFSQAFEGIIPSIERKLKEAKSEVELWELEPFLSQIKCPECSGARIKKEMLFVYLGGTNIAKLCELNISAAQLFLSELVFPKQKQPIAAPILKEIQSRLTFLSDVGLDYITLARSATSLSGGEGQRIRLASQIGSNLVGVLYILDEPSIGLHQRDNQRLLKTLERLRDQGNSVIVVEHDAETIERADFVVDLGPGAGEHGGEIVFMGSPQKLREEAKSLTGLYLSGAKSIPCVEPRKDVDRKFLKISQASVHNLKNIDVVIPLGTFVCVTGVSGSGKSSLIIDTLLPALSQRLTGYGWTPTLFFDDISGLEHLDKVVHVDQSPIGRTPRSNPATYTNTFGDIRTLFSQLPEAKMRGYGPSRFSFNVVGGRCEPCGGDGKLKVSMHFLPDVFVTCEVCKGRRYNRETLEVRYRDKNISDVLEMPVEEALAFFNRIPVLRTKLKTLLDVGLSYIRLGQNAITLSGGEAQRIKLSKELNRRASGRTLYILDEPTTGLHFEDIRKLLEILQNLVTQGNTVIVIEHNLDVIKQADYLIDLGPEGGDRGGYLVFQGTPKGATHCPESHTGRCLREIFKSIDQKGSKISKQPSTDNLTSK